MGVEIDNHLRKEAMTYQEWMEFAKSIRRRAEALDEAIHATGFRIAASQGLPPMINCIHNAAIDDNLVGWCFQNYARLSAAKHADYLLNQWPGSALADRIITKAWNRMAQAHGYASVREDVA